MVSAPCKGYARQGMLMRLNNFRLDYLSIYRLLLILVMKNVDKLTVNQRHIIRICEIMFLACDSLCFRLLEQREKTINKT